MKKTIFRTNRVCSPNVPYWFVATIFVSVFLVGCGGEKTEERPSEPRPIPENGELTAVPEIFETVAKAGDKTVDVQFTITNDQLTPVTITKLDTSCSCLKVVIKDTVLDPGESTILNAVFEIENLLGESEKLIEIYTAERNRAQFLQVRVSVPPIYEIEPKNITWKLNSEAKSKTIIYKTLRDKPIHVTAVRSSRPDLVEVSMKEIKKGREYEITISPKDTSDYLLGFVTIETDLEIATHQNAMGFFTISDFD